MEWSHGIGGREDRLHEEYIVDLFCVDVVFEEVHDDKVNICPKLQTTDSKEFTLSMSRH